MATRIQLARSDIVAELSRADPPIYRRRDLEKLLAQHRDEWRLSASTSFNEFLQYALKHTELSQIKLPFPSRPEVRYTWGRVPLNAVLMTLKSGCYFSHYTAMAMNGLTEQEPKTIYVNHEQPAASTPTAELAQDRIDSAFKRRPRLSNNFAKVGDVRVCLLNGRRTGRMAVETRTVDQAGRVYQLDVTDVDRTLIDAAVRPFYAGGVGEVLKAYRLAAPLASVNRIAALLRQLQFIYPYHQAVGFYLEASGAYRLEVVDRFHASFERDFDFYLTYQMRQTRYVEKWRLHVPQDL